MNSGMATPTPRANIVSSAVIVFEMMPRQILLLRYLLRRLHEANRTQDRAVGELPWDHRQKGGEGKDFDRVARMIAKPTAMKPAKTAAKKVAIAIFIPA